MENMTLEKELTARIMVHKLAITGGVLMQQYLTENTSGSVNLSSPTLMELADDYSDNIMKQAMANGTFNELYDKAWESIKNTLPEYTKAV